MMNIDNYRGIMVYGEVMDNKIADNSLELLGEARRLVDTTLQDDTQVIAVVFGDQVKKYADELMGYGADIVVVFEDWRLALYQPDTYGEVFTKVIEYFKPEIVLVGATAQGSELAPTVALKLKTGLAAHCMELKINENRELVQVVPAFGGKVLGDILCPSRRPQMATVKVGILQKSPYNKKLPNIEIFSCEIDGYSDRMKAIYRDRKAPKGRPLSEAEVIIGGGFGIGSRENWEMLEVLARLLNGATGCTRPALDEGWTQGDHTMIGTSGVAVRPKLYINAGISGAAHHTCGVKDGETIISINKNPNAPIFEVSDYKIVADWKKIVPLLVERLKELEQIK
jgi:electron transfer flavoprotein alpha subunit